MQNSQFPMNLSSEDTIDLLKDFLPEIEQELREQIEAELQEQYQTKLAEQFKNIQIQAEQEYQEALQTLENEYRQLKSQKQHALELQIVQLQHAHSERERNKLAQAQEKFLQEHFDDRMLNHPSLGQVQEHLEAEVGEELMIKYESIREKKVKELRVRIEGREQRERQEIDKSIRSEIYANSGLQQLKNDVNKFRISLASMKSKYNLKVTKLTKQCQELGEKCKKLDYQNSDVLISQIQTELASLKQTISKEEQQQEEEDSLQYNINTNYFMPYSGNNTFEFGRPAVEDAHYINEDIDMESQDSLESPSKDSSRFQEQLPGPPRQLTQMLSDPSDEGLQDQIYLELPQRPLFKFDVAKMLRQQWKEDAFDRYLSSRNKENQSDIQNQNSNSFQTLYAEHLRKLDRVSRFPTRRLSTRAKQQIMFGLAVQQRQMSYND